MPLIKKSVQTVRRAVWYSAFYDYTNKSIKWESTNDPAYHKETWGYYPSRALALDGIQSIIDIDLREAQAEHVRISKAITRARKEKA